MQQLRQKRVCLMCSLKVRNAGKPFMLENREKRKKTDFQAASQTHAGVPRNHGSQTRQPPKTPLQGQLWMGQLSCVIANKPQVPRHTSQ